MLPDSLIADPSVDALDAATRARVAQHWLSRARSERRVGIAFAAMAPRLAANGADPRVVARLASSADEEARHAALCERLASRYAGAPVEAAPLGDVPLPAFGFAGEDPALEDAVLVAGSCCVNETLATAWLGACLDASTTPLARAANRLHLAEEVGHAQLGWAHLASRAVGPRARRVLAELLPALLEANLPAWEAKDAHLPAEGVPGHGHPGDEAARHAIDDAVRDLVLPGFRHVGVDVRRGEAWLALRSRR